MSAGHTEVISIDSICEQIEKINVTATALITTLQAERDRYREALQEIAEGKGPFSTDQLTFAINVIENSKRIAIAALSDETSHLPKER